MFSRLGLVEAELGEPRDGDSFKHSILCGVGGETLSILVHAIFWSLGV